MHTFVFIDTNVLLHYQFFDEPDWPAQLGVTEVTLVFAPVVFSELDRHGWSGSRRERARAKSVLKKVNGLALSTSPVKVRAGVHAIALDAEPVDSLFAQHRLDPRTSDDRLLASFVEFRSVHSADRVLILSPDIGLSVKARSRRCEIVAPADTLELPPEPDDVERELDRVRRELNELKTAAPDLTITFGGGSTHERFRIRPVKDFDEATLQRLLDTWRSRHQHITPMPQAIQGSLGQVVSLEGLAGLPGFVSAADAAKYNATIDGYRGQYEMFLRLWPAAINSRRRNLQFALTLENTGAAPADDVEIQLSTKAAGEWLRELAKLPNVPKVPRPRSRFDTDLYLPMPYRPHLDHLDMIHPGANEDGPHISEGGGVQQVRYTVKRAKHHVPCELPVVYFQFESEAAVVSFTIDVILFAANIRKPKPGSLHVEIAVEAPVGPPLPNESVDDDDP
ncbi:MAG: PIN domain-containing protein [Vicinamibacterales bacterium]|nr:PIN domain-containing protein [Vicinamibacterales bacterium]